MGRSSRVDGRLPSLRWLGMWCLALALLVTPLAVAQSGDGGVQGRAAVGEGDPLTGGERNPSANQTEEFQAETEIIGDIAASTQRKGGYVTRQSNTQTGPNAGGAAIYGCRAPAGGTPGDKEACLRANNLGGGTALELQSNGLPALFQVGQSLGTVSNQPPFATNAGGVVANLNADKVDGMDAEQIIAQASGTPGPRGPEGPAAESISTYDTYFETLDGDGAEVTLAENGPLRYFARCTVNDAGTDRIEVLVESTTDDAFSGDGGDLTANTEEVVFSNSTTTGDPRFGRDIDADPAVAMEGSTGSYIGIDGETLGLGLNIFGHDCVVAGSAFFADGEL